MLKILVPVDASHNALLAVRHVVNEFRKNPALEIHLLNVQTPFSRYVSRFVGAGDRHDFHREQGELALLPARQMLDSHRVPFTAHVKIGDKAFVIADTARQLGCDHIVMSTTRKSSLIRMIESSTTNKLIELTTVPVKVVAGDPASPLERYGIPAGVSMGLASLFLAAAE